jgi:hypothetical protein
MTVLHRIQVCVRVPEGSLNPQAYILSTHPIIDSKRWIRLDIFENFNDVFFKVTRNAYCIYLVHYIFVLWCQYELLNVDLPAFIKFLITFIVSILVSWQVSILLRKIPVVRKYV